MYNNYKLGDKNISIEATMAYLAMCGVINGNDSQYNLQVKNYGKII